MHLLLVICWHAERVAEKELHGYSTCICRFGGTLHGHIGSSHRIIIIIKTTDTGMAKIASVASRVEESEVEAWLAVATFTS